MMKFVRSMPMAVGGLSLAFAALGNLLLPLPYGEVLRYISGFLSVSILILFMLKVILDFPHAREELKTPVVLSVLPATTMTVMLLCVYLSPYLGAFAVVIWYLAIIAHLSFMFIFYKKFILDFKLNTVFPSWFIAFVGIATVSITAPVMGNVFIGQLFFFLGFFLYFVSLALIVWRMKTVKIFPEPIRPTIAIFTAPMSLLIVGYINSFLPQGQYSRMLLYFMIFIAIASYIYVTAMMFFLLRIKFYPTYAAFTFPYVISAIAFRSIATFFAENELGGILFFTLLAHLSQWIAIAVVLYVLYHYIRFFIWWLKF
jgi:exfoliative toxin A/B